MTTLTSNNQQKDIRISSSIIQQAIQDNPDAIATMFQQFLPENESIHLVQYLGLQGLWGFGTHEFACLTDRRIADITVGRFGKINYQDGYLEHINSSYIFQPSKLKLYITVGILFSFPLLSLISLLPLFQFFGAFLIALILFGVSLLLLPLVVQWYYRFNKCGIVIAVRGGIPIYIFTNRKLLTRANTLCRQMTISREERIKLRGVV
ncbi:hypothetical protein [Calothrix sp. UHCC 0171]|uniref:hypothetical protein n=1 Tax=Calothrix sp. UHCC 0171 TaxID=3110245 RepID=UPI002B2077F5|nr:hypothetical protein [Calothrix sp. UHCC 0171]MEA5570567.1 hypothetical protein [Calothrix sp. UHCC 0171]